MHQRCSEVIKEMKMQRYLERNERIEEQTNNFDAVGKQDKVWTYTIIKLLLPILFSL